MSTGMENNIHYLQVPKGLSAANLPEIKAELDRVLADIIDNGLNKFVLDLTEFDYENPVITKFIFKAMEDCQTLQIKLRFVAKSDFARLVFGLDRLAKLPIFKDRAAAVTDF